MDDQEFLNAFSKQNYTLEEVKNIIRMLNELCYTILRKRLQIYIQSKEICIKLLRELYDRDSRKKFCQQSIWLISEINSHSNQLFLNRIEEENGEYKEILDKMPYVYSFDKRAYVFRYYIEVDKQNYNRSPYGINNDNNYDDDDEDFNSQSRTARIRREFVFEDGYNTLKNKNLKNLIKIKFLNYQGLEELGVDIGGLFKEFITLLSLDVFDLQRGLFLEIEDKTLIPNPHSDIQPEYKELFYFIGKITAKAVYEGLNIQPVFSRVFLNKLLLRQNTIDELFFLDSTLYKNLMELKHTQGIADHLSLTFSINEKKFDEVRVVNLKKDGDKQPVTEQNKIDYIYLYANYKLEEQIEIQSKYFLKGFLSVIQTQWLKLFNHDELQLIISGDRTEIDIDDLKDNILLKNCQPNDQTIVHLWKVLRELSPQDKSDFLFFIIGCSRPPLMGFSHLNPKISIHLIDRDLGPDNPKLPTASTCINTLYLPDYKDRGVLQKKLIYAIKSKAGFELA